MNETPKWLLRSWQVALAAGALGLILVVVQPVGWPRQAGLA
jgi:hypothetical protein